MTQLIKTADVGLSKFGSEDDFKAVSGSFSFLPRIQLFSGNSDMVKKGKIPIAHYGLVVQKDQVEDLGPEVDLLPICWRPKSMRITEDQPLSYFNPKTPEFQTVQKDSEQPNSGCMFGPEFLVWVPIVKRYASFFMSSKTARNRAPELRALMGYGATLGVQLIETTKYTWHGPTVRACSTEFDVPDMEDVKKQAEIFNNPADSVIEFDPADLEKEEPATGRAR